MTKDRVNIWVWLAVAANISKSCYKAMISIGFPYEEGRIKIFNCNVNIFWGLEHSKCL